MADEAQPGRPARASAGKEASLADPGRLLHTLSRAVAEGIVLLSPDRQLDFVSRGAQSLFGCVDRESFETRWEQTKAALDSALVELNRASREQPVLREVAIRTDTGERRLRLEVLEVQEEDCTGYMVLIKDLASISSLEHNLRLAGYMRTLSVLYRACLHDLRAPLNAMVLNLELLRESLDAAEQPAARERRLKYVDVVHAQVDRIARGLEMLLKHNFAVEGERRRFDLREVIGEVADLVEPFARSRQLRVESQPSPAPVHIRAFRDRIHQVLLNLVNNGLEAMSPGGVLRIRLARDGERVSVRVEDEGPGLPPDIDPERLFDPSFTEKETGHGVGLYATRLVARDHGGDVRISRGAAGAVAELSLPLEPDG
jgi:signal transduction histidine kinase